MADGRWRLLTDDEQAAVLAALMELVLGWGSGDRCARCGHGADCHRLDDRTNVSPTDPFAKFRCVWPVTVSDRSPAVQLCACPDFIAP